MTNSKNLDSFDIAIILNNRTMLKALSDNCKKMQKLIDETKQDMKNINDELPDEYKLENNIF